ncbi:MAG: DUF3592 domain-containing protein [Micavibrio aeruginosavorus]|uniref:DUF3592 domain-containing protein n=1 Tax=Micavibrio aeruginosavorus TaxID=349221 RepID=A0A7T5R471_9BACT|nr:MAG: DUF3592 domain-containing protein [Micavibrio aeruginosavorus]
MIGFIFEVLGAVNQLLFVLMGLVFFGIGGVMSAYPVWQRLRHPRVKARIVELYGDRAATAVPQQDKTETVQRQGLRSSTMKSDVTRTPGAAVAAGFVVLLFLGIPLTFIAIGGYFAYDYFDLKASGLSAHGTVVRIEEYTDSEGDTSYTPVVEFADRSGVTQQHKSRVSSRQFDVGGRVDVIYEDGDPGHFIIDLFWHNMIVPVVCIGMGSLFLFLMFFAGRAQFRPRREIQPSSYRPKAFSTMFYPVYEYIAPDGRLLRAQSKDASNWIPGHLPGTEVMVSLSPDNYERVEKTPMILFIFGLIFLTPGIFILSESIKGLEFGFPLFIAAAGFFGFIGFKLSRTIKPRHLWETRDQFRERMNLKRNKAGKNGSDGCKGVLLTPQEISDFLLQHDRAMAIWSPLYVLLATAMIVGGYYLYNKQSGFEATAMKARGEVVRLISKSDSDGMTYYPEISFTTRDGREIEFRDSVGSNPPSAERGDEVKVLYNPERPSEAIVDRGWFNLLPGVGLLWIGGMWLVGSLKSWAQSLIRLSGMRR